MDALKQRYADGKAKAKQHADTGARARASGDLVSAMDAYRAALALTPQDAALRATFEEVGRLASDRIAETHARQAELDCS
jgi:hypothetical protein